MRTFRDRLRHALGFEIIGLILIAPAGAWLFATPLHDIGLVAVVSSVIATIWNYAYNLGFDTLMQRRWGHTAKTPALRVLHAVTFEAGLLLVLLPFIAWYLGLTLWQALVMDLSFAGFYLVYALGFNWVYDILFPLTPAHTPRTGKAE